MDTTQVILLIIVVVLAVFLVALGFQAFFVLRDLRRSLVRANRLFDDTEDLLFQIRKPIESAGSFVSALTAGAGISHLLKRGDSKEKKK